MDLVYMSFSLVLFSSTLIRNCYGVTTDIHSTIPDTTLNITDVILTTPEVTLTTHEVTLTKLGVTRKTTREATLTTLEVTLNTTKEQITDGRPDYTWIAYVVVGSLMLPLAVVSIVNCIRVKRGDDTQEKETL
ncbi:Hypothetical predicted protein [Mytilus galloprovincialis]|uniref:Uncharacterized protein n=1 Tax=Mytilus galloprovincialis TaxID=29158 RepID=A0A8B6DUL9_MYTGA|nr:Hypothetical predicted protein [Mytilus galloprovincialis]